MEKYNHSLQYKFALDAVCRPLDSQCVALDEFKHVELLIASSEEIKGAMEVKFICVSTEENKSQLTEKILIT